MCDYHAIHSMDSLPTNCFYGGGLALAIISFASVMYQYTRRTTPKTPRKTAIHDVIMFAEVQPSELIPSKFSRSLVHQSMDRLFAYLNQAQHSLDICMYMITNSDVAHMMQKLKQRGVKIRFIVDADMAYASGSATKRIEKQGIEIRWMKSTNFMHHKFCVVDASHDVKDSSATPFVMIGSLNWTSQAFKGNWENVLVTSKAAIVKGLKEEFERLWVEFKPIDRIQN